MAVLMNMSSYEIESGQSVKTRYGEEVLYSGWNPAVMLACQQPLPCGTEKRVEMPSSLADADTELFLHRMYLCQR
jgi:hypothetical protein